MAGKDLLGSSMNTSETALFDVYQRLKALASDDSLAPCVVANVRHALAAVAQAVNDLALEYEHLIDLEV